MIYAFDFDGVIADSAKGSAFFSHRAWKRLGNKNAPPVKSIEKHRPYISTAKDNYGLLFLLSNNMKVTRAAVRKVAEENPEKAKIMSDTFFDEKEKFIKTDKEKFCRLYGPFRFIVPIMQRLSRKETVYIVTSNKKSQVIDILCRSKIAVKPENILDSTISKNKSDLIKIVARREKVSTFDIMFVEDSIDHIKEVIPTGVNAALASWGFVLKEDIKEAKKLGIKVLDKKNLITTLNAENTEYFDVIDKSNKVIGKAPRDECHRKGLLHRSVHIMILNRKVNSSCRNEAKRRTCIQAGGHHQQAVMSRLATIMKRARTAS